MSYSQQQLNAIFMKTNGKCHICGGILARQSYGIMQTLGSWEVDHFVPQAKGGVDHFSNLFPACVFCNRSKQDHRKMARRKHDFRVSLFLEEENG